MRPGLRYNHFPIITNHSPLATHDLLQQNGPFVNTHQPDPLGYSHPGHYSQWLECTPPYPALPARASQCISV